ncbi:MAG TPA: ATP-dependent Clp protease ATP-binding subunit [Candidatus Mcinerneyibacteriales bacterium]|nr:ATP-dependent Clp protease ATP-binding subunit [Candidatus Mcinerneyibacteriales bacterium]
MMNIFDTFSDRAREAVYQAGSYARKYNNNFIGAEHLLLALLDHKGKVLEKVLAALNISDEAVSGELERFLQPGRQQPGTEGDNLTPGVKMILRLAFEEANEMGHQYVGPEHLFLGILRESENVSYRVLKSLGADLDLARQKVREYTRMSQKEGVQISEQDEYLNRYSVDLISRARQNKLDPVIGREKEIERLIHILSRRMKNNPVLIGDAGVGKTAIVDGLALRVVENDVPEVLREKKILSLDMAALLAGAKYMGEFEERLKKVLEIIKERREIILFIDEIHTIIGAGRSGGAMDAANILKPVLARGDIQCIGATTVEEYRTYIEKDPALERRFQPIFVEEPNLEDAVRILKGIKEKYETFHRVHITDDALESAVFLSARYISDRHLPDKAVDLIDEAAAMVRLNAFKTPEELHQLERKLDSIRREKESAFNDGDYEKVAHLGVEEKQLEQKLKEVKEEWEDKRAREQRDNVVRRDDVARIISRWTGIPVNRLTAEESARFLEMESWLHKRVVGQQEAIRKVSEVVRTSRAGLSDPDKPAGVFLFLGPTGVGKTEVSKALTEFLYGDESLLIRIDMSEYMEKHAVARLIGSPPGYVGHEEGGQLTELVRRKPFSVILLDEIEKAHPDVMNILLQLFDEGRLTDGKGRNVNFRNTIIIMTSNIGAQHISDRLTAEENGSAEAAMEDLDGIIRGLLHQYFKPEFLNRVDEMVLFTPLSREEIREIVILQLQRIAERLKNQGITLEYTDDFLSLMVDKGYDPTMGARPLKRLLQQDVTAALSREILSGRFQKGDHIALDEEKGLISLKKAPQKKD